MNSGEQSGTMMNGPTGEMQHVYGQYGTPNIRPGYPNQGGPRPPHPNMPQSGMHSGYNAPRYPMQSGDNPGQPQGSTPTLNQLLLNQQQPRPQDGSYTDYGMAGKGAPDMQGFQQWNNQQRPVNSYQPHMHPNGPYRNPVSSKINFTFFSKKYKFLRGIVIVVFLSKALLYSFASLKIRFCQRNDMAEKCLL